LLLIGQMVSKIWLNSKKVRSDFINKLKASIINFMEKKNDQPQKTDKPLFDNLRKLINLIDSFRDVGLH